MKNIKIKFLSIVLIAGLFMGLFASFQTSTCRVGDSEHPTHEECFSGTGYTGYEDVSIYIYNKKWRKAYYKVMKSETFQFTSDYTYGHGVLDERITALLNSWQNYWGMTKEETDKSVLYKALGDAYTSDGIKRLIDNGFLVGHIQILKDLGFLDKSYVYSGSENAKGKIWAWDGNYKKSMTNSGTNKFKLNVSTNSSAKMRYSSSDKSVATVDSKGKVTMKHPGKTIITIKTAASKPYTAASKKVKVTVLPGKASELTAASSDDGITLEWTAGKMAEKYQVYRKTTDGDWEKIANVSETKYTDSDIEAGETYYYKVRSYTKYNGKNYLAKKYSGSASVTFINSVEATPLYGAE